ncbi:hypothetical protein [Rhizobium leguminosarum]
MTVADSAKPIAQHFKRHRREYASAPIAHTLALEQPGDKSKTFLRD